MLKVRISILIRKVMISILRKKKMEKNLLKANLNRRKALDIKNIALRVMSNQTI